MGGPVFPPHSLALGDGSNGNFLQKDLGQRTEAPRTVAVSAPDPVAAHCCPHLCWRLPNTHRQVWLSLLWGHCSFLLHPGTHKTLLCPPSVCFPSPVEVLKSNPTGLQSQIPWGFSVSLLNSQVGKSVVGPRTFPTGQEPLSYNCSPVCGSSAQWIYSGANRDLLQEVL